MCLLLMPDTRKALPYLEDNVVSLPQVKSIRCTDPSRATLAPRYLHDFEQGYLLP